MALLNGPDKGSAARKTLWIVDWSFRWTPFGVVGQIHGDSFLTEGRSVRDKMVANLRKHLKQVFWDRDRRWVIVFPEGGFLYKRRGPNVEFARKNGYPVLENLVLPRTGAVGAVLEVLGPRQRTGSCASELATPTSSETSMSTQNSGKSLSGSDDEVKERAKGKKELLKATFGAIREKKYVKETQPHVKYVVDMTIAYPDILDPPGLHTIIFGIRQPTEIKVYYRIFNIEEVPRDSGEALREWMYGVWLEKDRLLKDYYRTGVFAWGEEGRALVPRWWKLFTQHSFFIFSGYLYWRWLLRPLFHLLGKLFIPPGVSDWLWII